MKEKYIIIFTIFISLYSLINYYIGKVIFKNINYFFNISPLIFWTFFWMLAFSYIISIISNKFLSYKIIDLFSLIGAYWLGLIMYSLLTFPLLSLLNYILKKLFYFNNEIYKFEAILITLLLFIILLIGNYNAKHSYVKTFDIKLHNKNLEYPLNIVMVSDIHLGNIVKNNRLKNMVIEINKLNPDIIIIAGDIIDSDINPFLNNNMAIEFSKLRSKYGTFATLGNHDILTKSEEKIVNILNENSVKVLRDEAILINDSFYIIGRDDISVDKLNNKPRLSLNDLTINLDKNKPLILIDHNPKYVNESLDNNIDLQLSGHTHKGQISPGNIVTNKLFDIHYGYLKKDSLNVVVSSGYGTWGPPLRLGSKSEIVQINLK